MIIQFFLIYSIWPIKDIFEKWVLENQIISVYKLLFWEGCVEILLTLSIILLAELTSFEAIFFFKNMSNSFYAAFYNFFNAVLFFGFLLTSLGFAVTLLSINKSFTPIHRANIETVCPFIFILFMKLNSVESIENGVLIINIIGVLIISFFSLVYNDMVILYFCGMQMYTNKEILKRANDEIKEIELKSNECLILEQEY